MNIHPITTTSLLFLTCTAYAAPPEAEGPAKADASAWRALFDGKTLKGWKVTNFGGEGEVSVQDGCITMEFGSSLTGITCQGELPTADYEISLEANHTGILGVANG